MATILPDSRITIEITAIDQTVNISAKAELIIDTGADISALLYQKLSTALKNATLGNPITFYVAGSQIQTMLAKGPTSEADVESHGGGGVSQVQCATGLRVHFVSLPSSPFTSFDGLLGMELLDCFQADPVKDLTGARAYLAKRA
jgi:hypothetical protein